MANIYALNQVPSGPNQARSHYMAWDLTRQMIAAGWQVYGSSDGTSFSTSGTDYWTSFAGAENAGSWIALINPDGLRGFSFQATTVSVYATPYGRVFGSTQTGWSSSGVNATTAPLAIGTTSYHSKGTPSAPWYSYFSAGAADGADAVCAVYHLIVMDAVTDGTIFAAGFKNGGGSPGANLVHFFAASSVYSPWDLPISDNYVFWQGTGPTVTNGWLPGTYSPPSTSAYSGTQFWAKPPLDSALRGAKCAPSMLYPGGVNTIDRADVYDGFGDGTATSSGSSTLMLESMPIYTDGGLGPIYKGVAKWIASRNNGISNGFQGTYDWYAFDVGAGGGFLWIPWDGVTTTFSSGT